MCRQRTTTKMLLPAGRGKARAFVEKMIDQNHVAMATTCGGGGVVCSRKGKRRESSWRTCAERTITTAVTHNAQGRLLKAPGGATLPLVGPTCTPGPCPGPCPAPAPALAVSVSGDGD